MSRSIPWDKVRGDPHRCHYCGTALNDYNRTRDHIVPKALGGTQALINTTFACFTCNQSKRDEMRWCACVGCMAAHAYHAALMASRLMLPE